MAINPTTPATLYTGTYDGGVFKSTDSGGTWAPANFGLTSMDVRTLAINPTTPATLYAGTIGGGLFKSTDSGGTWTPANFGLTNPDVYAVAINPTTPATLYAGTWGGGVFKSTDSGGTWAAPNIGLGVFTLAISPTTPATLYAGTYDGVFKSSDSGGSWAATGLTTLGVCALAINPTTPTTLYAGTYGGGAFKSTNSGGIWAAANTGLTYLDVAALAINLTTPTTLYAGAYDGVFKSTNSGGTWAAANTGLTTLQVGALAINPTTPATLYAGTGGMYDGGGVFKSTDSGGTWAAANTGLTNLTVVALAINPTTPTMLYAGTSGGGVFKSTNSGGTWAAVNTGLTNISMYVAALAINPTTPATLYAGTDAYGGPIFKSNDSGGTWVAVNTGLPGLLNLYAYALVINPTTPATLYAGTSDSDYHGGVFKSTDSGGTWTAANTGLPNVVVNALALDPTGATTLYAGLQGRSVWQLTAAGSSTLPAITTQPSNQAVAAGANATFTVAASGTPAPTLQWQMSTNGGSTFTDLTNAGPYSGVTTATFTISAAPSSFDGRQFRCVATNSAGSVTSTSATLTVTVGAGGQEVTVTLAGGVALTMVRIPAGTFQMGALASERGTNIGEQPQHQVTLTSDYYMGKYLVTQGQWQAVMGTAMSTACGSYGIGASYPVYCVSWNDIRGTGGFIEKLNTYLTSTGQAGAGKFRLPTEAEWERAARGGTQTRFSFGDALECDDACGTCASADPYVWWCGNSGSTSHPVGTKQANPYGLFDMHGNLWEWCEDWSGAYGSSAQTNPTGPITGSSRVVRGGGWYYLLQSTRSADRNYIGPDYRNNNIGFRLSRSLDAPAVLPSTPTPLSPGGATEGQTISTLTPTLQWTPGDGATNYAITISASPYGWNSVVYSNASAVGTSLTLPSGVLVNGGRYRWEMTAINSAGASVVSTSLYFQVVLPGILPLPAPPVALAPGSGFAPGPAPLCQHE